MVKMICSICGYTLQNGEDNVDIDNYRVCEKCNKKWKIIIDYYTKGNE